MNLVLETFMPFNGQTNLFALILQYYCDCKSLFYSAICCFGIAGACCMASTVRFFMKGSFYLPQKGCFAKSIDHFGKREFYLVHEIIISGHRKVIFFNGHVMETVVCFISVAIGEFRKRSMSFPKNDSHFQTLESHFGAFHVLNDREQTRITTGRSFQMLIKRWLDI